jgi:hypothetical protein
MRRVRWLRPDFQAPEETRRAAAQPALDIEEPEAPDAIQWPRDDAASQFIALRTALARSPAPAAPRAMPAARSRSMSSTSVCASHSCHSLRDKKKELQHR